MKISSIERKKRYADGRKKYKKWRTEMWKKEPWRRVVSSCQSRCGRGGDYEEKGIKCYVTYDEMKYLWFRDKPWLLKRPSIDRIDAKRDYIINNCRFIELGENVRRSRISSWGTNRKTRELHGECKNCGKISSPHHGNGLCSRCYLKLWRKIKKLKGDI